MGFSNPIVGSGGALVRPAIKSPNYTPGSAGWMVSRTGNAEFNDLVVRGTFQGTQFVINSAGTFFYSPTPGAGNLVGSWASTGGVDAYGNTYFAGLVSYNGPASDNEYAQVFNGSLAVGVGEDPVHPFGPNPGLVAVLGDSSAMTLISPHTTALPATAEVDLVAAPAGKTSGQTAYQHTATFCDAWVTGIQRKAKFVGFTLTPETPQTPSSYGTSFAGGSTFSSTSFKELEFWIDAEDNLRIAGAFQAIAAATSGNVFTLPVGYRPANAWVVPLATLTSTGTAIASQRILQIAATGIVSCKSPAAMTIGDNLYVDVALPMGNLA